MRPRELLDAAIAQVGDLTGLPVETVTGSWEGVDARPLLWSNVLVI